MDPTPGAAPNVPPQPPSAASLPLPTWTRSAQIALGLLLAAGLFFMLGRWSTQGSRSDTDPLERSGPCLDLNRATKAELRLLPGLGESLALRIVDHRKRHGPFRTVDDLRQVSGVGAKTLYRLRPWLFVSPETPAVDDTGAVPAAVRVASKASPASIPAGKKEQATSPININFATQAELQKIPGIGPKLSQRILDERAKAAFKSVEELRRVPGIGAKTLEKMRPFVMIDEVRPQVAAAED